MKIRTTVLLSAVACITGAWAQSPGGGVTQSLDPAAAASVERKVEKNQARKDSRAAPEHPQSADGLVRGQLATGRPFVSGGVTIGQQQQMRAMRGDFSFWLSTVAKPSGAYMSDARLSITNATTKAPLIDMTMYGPWFFAALEPGDYEITATVPGDGSAGPQTLSTRAHVVKGRLHEAVLRFASSAQVSPDPVTPSMAEPSSASAPAQ